MEPTKVTRRLRAGAPGTLKQGRRHGDALVCVRYRENMQGTVRYTTIELVVDRRPVGPQHVELNLNWGERELRAVLIAHGASWDATRKVWLLGRKIANQLKLQARAKAAPKRRLG